MVNKFEEIISWQKAKDLREIDDARSSEFYKLTIEISRLLSGLIKTQ